MSRDVVAAMTAYTLELREAEIKLNQNEGPVDFPIELKAQVLARIAEHQDDDAAALKEYTRLSELRPNDERVRKKRDALLAARKKGAQ